MRLFWKLFCSMVAMTALACSIGGFLMIDGQFRAGLNAQAEGVVTEHIILRHMLLREMQFSHSFSQVDVAHLADDTAASLGRGDICFRISDGQGQVLAGSALPAESCLVSRADTDPVGLGGPAGGGALLPACGKSHSSGRWDGLSGKLAESGRPLSTRQAQYNVFFYLLVGLILASVASGGGSKRLDYQAAGRLSEATRQMAAGEFSRRVEVQNDDEIGQLSRDFNRMAEQLESHVGELMDTARRQEDFLHAFAHETKTPLTSIIGYAELLLSRPAQPQLVQESAACIFREGRRLEGLSRKLLDIFVLEKNGVSLRRTEIDSLFAAGMRCAAPDAGT